MENRIDATLGANVRQEVLTKIQEIRDLLPFLQDLTVEERRELPKMGDKSRAFVEGALTLAEQDDSFLPRSFDVSEMRQDVDLTAGLAPIQTALAQLSELVEDTMTLAGSDAFLAGLIVYQSAQRNGRGEALDNLAGTLGRRFARKSKDTATDNPPNP